MSEEENTVEEEKTEKLAIPESYFEDIRKDTEINQFDLKNECAKSVNRTQRYIEDYYQQRRRLKKLELAKSKRIGELFSYYKTDFEIKLTSSQDIMKFVEKDKRYQSLMKFFYEQEAIVEFLDRTIKNLNNKVWLIQKMVDLEKMQ